MATYPLSEAFTDGQVLTAANVNSTNEGVNDIVFGQFNIQSGTTYTLALTDVAKWIVTSSNSAVTITIPTNASVAFPLGTQIMFLQAGNGQITIAGAVGVTVTGQGSKLKSAGLYGVIACIKNATDSWVVFGNTVL